jgi:hypothetical protein
MSTDNKKIKKKWQSDEKLSLIQHIWNNDSYKEDYENAAEFLNSEYNNNRTAKACRNMYSKINKQNNDYSTR